MVLWKAVTAANPLIIFIFRIMQTELEYWPNKLLQEFSLTYFYYYDAEGLL